MTTNTQNLTLLTQSFRLIAQHLFGDGGREWIAESINQIEAAPSDDAAVEIVVGLLQDDEKLDGLKAEIQDLKAEIQDLKKENTQLKAAPKPAPKPQPHPKPNAKAKTKANKEPKAPTLTRLVSGITATLLGSNPRYPEAVPLFLQLVVENPVPLTTKEGVACRSQPVCDFVNQQLHNGMTVQQIVEIVSKAICTLVTKTGKDGTEQKQEKPNIIQLSSLVKAIADPQLNLHISKDAILANSSPIAQAIYPIITQGVALD